MFFSFYTNIGLAVTFQEKKSGNFNGRIFISSAALQMSKMGVNTYTGGVILNHLDGNFQFCSSFNFYYTYLTFNFQRYIFFKVLYFIFIEVLRRRIKALQLN